jgi:hypothetical protein
MLPSDLLRRKTLPALLLDAEVRTAALKFKRERIRRLVSGKDAFEAYAVLLGEIAGEL